MGTGSSGPGTASTGNVVAPPGRSVPRTACPTRGGLVEASFGPDGDVQASSGVAPRVPVTSEDADGVLLTQSRSSEGPHPISKSYPFG